MHKNEKINSLSEAEILSRCIKKDPEAFKNLVEMYQQFAYNIAYKILLNEENAKDMVQESFIRIWNHFTGYRKEVLFTTWLYKIVVNLCYDKLKSEKRRNHIEITTAEKLGYSLTESSDQDSQRNEKKSLIKEIRVISKKLTLKQRLVFVLRDIQNLSVREVCDILKMTEGAVKTNLYLARMFIREQLLKPEKSGGN